MLTASADVQITRELTDSDVSPDDYDVQPILPEKFRDYLFTLYPDLEAEETRVSPSSIRTGTNSLPVAIDDGDLSGLTAELQKSMRKSLTRNLASNHRSSSTLRWAASLVTNRTALLTRLGS